MKVAIGFFDGVHLGHQAILKDADAALTFRNHPLTVLASEKAPRLIMSVEERVAAIKACGVGEVTVLDFTRELAETSAEEFVARHLMPFVSRLPSSVHCGANWRFGKDGAGDAAFLRSLGIDVVVVPYVEYKDERVSSSRIRRCLENGEIEDANAMLGRRFKVQGLKFKGKELGAKIGYPTINLKLEALNLKLPLGVYEVEAEGRKAIANYGLAPTMGDRAWSVPTMEMHFLHCPPPPLPSTSVNVGLLRFIRKEMKFDSIDDLKRQIAADCATIAT
ncbi:MAG: riboflavin biosynthesis protein RibF [bacterium]|nr:riboflavin biosynthesis protein RibF [Candidatus Colisoma equi]